MRFISKTINLGVVLDGGRPKNIYTGDGGASAVVVRFVDGVVDVKDDWAVEKMLNHRFYKKDFVAANDAEAEEFLKSHKSSEPEHTIIDFSGHLPKKITPSSKLTREEEIKKMVKEEAVKIAKTMVQEIMNQQKIPAENDPAVVKEPVATKEPADPAVTKESQKTDFAPTVLDATKEENVSSVKKTKTSSKK